ncbi:DUF1552 domain-containing protein [Bdellovibrio sp. SKB1291214]|uniref:DUF1552 domain-containing protein n=1 Tax=Bdellovibrio sp. SKB1291214 TaxID=1732569 RepID=UPI000B51B2CA|nr:DUF1552 domain-containing protein [Bdellovibrio sp. SKB1291214]UYL09409.1 DUF1552 domain-containing protein [Bdellovibrio sp. SKB1291214]
MHWNKLSRRQFLRGTGGFALALPFLPSMLPQAEAQTGPTLKKRFIAIHNGHCQAVEHWLPDPAKFTWNEKQTYAREVALSAIPNTMSPVLGSQFDSLRSKLLILSRLDPLSKTPNHNAECMLTGGVLSEATSSIDQVIAKFLYGGSPLNLYVKSVDDGNYTGASHVSVLNKQYVPGQFNPSAVFSSMFGSGPTTTPTNTADKLTRRDILVVDKVYAEYVNLRSNKRLSKDDLARVEQHMALINDLQKKLNANVSAPPAMTCNSPTGPSTSPTKSSNPADYQVVIDQMFDVIEVGVKCGKIQVATLMMHVYDYFSGSVNFVPGITGSNRFHEDINHAGTSELRAMKLAMMTFFANRVSRFLTRMDVVEDSTTGSTYLDNSLILWGNDQGTTKNTNAHNSVNNPVLLAGSAGGYLKPGRHIDYGPSYGNLRRPIGGDEGDYKRGRPYNQLLITIMQAMGMQPADYEVGATQGYGVYGTLESSYTYLGVNHRREILPLIKG